MQKFGDYSGFLERTIFYSDRKYRPIRDNSNDLNDNDDTRGYVFSQFFSGSYVTIYKKSNFTAPGGLSPEVNFDDAVGFKSFGYSTLCLSSYFYCFYIHIILKQTVQCAS